jgi:Domain of unknown function (DUF2017)
VAAAFRRLAGDRFRLRLAPHEVELLRGLPEQLRSMLGDAADPVNRRLLPPAYLQPQDADADAEYRRLMQDDLVETKLANLDQVAATLERGELRARRWTVELSEEEALAWLGVLNDVRLALGVRLDITEDYDGSSVDPADPRAPAMHLLSYLGWLEEQLVEALAR